MILVDYDIAKNLNTGKSAVHDIPSNFPDGEKPSDDAESTRMEELDRQLHNILNDKDLDSSEKAGYYNDLLRQYRLQMDNRNNKRTLQQEKMAKAIAALVDQSKQHPVKIKKPPSSFAFQTSTPFGRKPFKTKPVKKKRSSNDRIPKMKMKESQLGSDDELIWDPESNTTFVSRKNLLYKYSPEPESSDDSKSGLTPDSLKSFESFVGENPFTKSFRQGSKEGKRGGVVEEEEGEGEAEEKKPKISVWETFKKKL